VAFKILARATLPLWMLFGEASLAAHLRPLRHRHLGSMPFSAEGRPDMNHHPRFNIVQSSLAAGLKTEVIVLDVLCDGWSGYG
jgi:hypothetical protein